MTLRFKFNSIAKARSQAQPQQRGAGKRAPTDDELRDRWLKHHTLIAFGLGDWRKYENGIWQIIEEKGVKQQLQKIIEKAKREGVRPTSNRLFSVHEISKITCFIPAEKWDANPDLLVCKNGMLHIPTRILKKHDPDARITTGVPYNYDPQAGCPAFMQALSRHSFGIVKFIQEFAGYCLTTDTRHETTVWFWGDPGSGKSSIIGGLYAMLGNRAGILSLKQVAQSRFGLANIEGKTLVFSYESPSLYLETTDILNAIISGEMIPIERKFKDPVQIIPRAKILWAMNKLPRIGDAGNGIFRRVKIVKFAALPLAQQDPLLKEQILEEGAGILNWALLGLDRLRKRGKFEIPQEVEDATKAFQEGSDPESVFVREECEVDPNNKIQSSVLYAAYKQWCYDNGHKAKSSTSIAQEWQRLGFSKYRSAGRTYFEGLTLNISLIGGTP